jgi:hypothetical protein
VRVLLGDAFENREHLSRKGEIRGELFLKALEFCAVRESTVPKEVDDFLEAALG